MTDEGECDVDLSSVANVFYEAVIYRDLSCGSRAKFHEIYGWFSLVRGVIGLEVMPLLTEPIDNTNAPVVEYRPRFVLWTSFFAQVPLQLFFAFWSGGFVGGMLQSMLPRVAASLSFAGNPFVSIGVLVFVMFPVVTLVTKAMNYGNTIYRVFPDRLVVEEGFLTQHRKEIALSGVREVNLRRGILQQMIGLGSVYVATQATGNGEGWKSFSALGVPAPLAAEPCCVTSSTRQTHIVF